MRVIEEDTEADVSNKNRENEEANDNGEDESFQAADDSDDSDNEGTVLTGKDADFASELKNRLYK